MTVPPTYREVQAVERARNLFSEEHAAEIISHVNSVGTGFSPSPDEFAEDLARNLNTLGAYYFGTDYVESLPRPHELTPRLRHISQLCLDLITALDAERGGVSHDLGPGVLWKSAKIRGAPNGEAAVAEAVEQVRYLGKVAAFAANLNAVEAAASPPPRGRRQNKAINDLVQSLGDTFLWLWRSDPGRATDRETGASGRFPRFVDEVLDRIAPNEFTPHNIDAIIRRHLDKDKLK